MSTQEHDYAAEERMRGAAKEMYSILCLARSALRYFEAVARISGDGELAAKTAATNQLIDKAIAKAEGRS